MAQHLQRDLNAEHNSSATKTRNETAGNEENQVGQHVNRDFNAEHNSSDTKTKNKIQVAIRPSRRASTFTEISTLYTTTVTLKQRIKYSWQ